MELEFAGGLFGTSLIGLEIVIKIGLEIVIKKMKRRFRPGKAIGSRRRGKRYRR